MGFIMSQLKCVVSARPFVVMIASNLVKFAFRDSCIAVDADSTCVELSTRVSK